MVARGRDPVDATFKLIFGTVTALTVALFGLDEAVALTVAVPTPSQADLMETSATFAKVGMGVIFGLLGGSADPARRGRDVPGAAG